MSALAEAVIAAFGSNTELTWHAETPSLALARFEVIGVRVETTFEETGPGDWRAGFKASSKAGTTENIHASIRVFSGVFQAVREFLEVRQPKRLVFAAKEEALAHLYEQYLSRQESPLRDIGYRMITPVKMSPLSEFAIEKTPPSAWNEINR